jgi:predicted Zn-dependent protease
MIRRLVASVRAGLRDLGNIFSLRRPGGIGAGLASAGREVGRVVGLLLSAIDPRNLIAVIRRDTRAVANTGRFVAASTTRTIGESLWLVLTTPFRVIWWLLTSPLRLYWLLRTRSPAQAAIGLIVAACGLVAAAYPAYFVVKERRIEGLRQVQYRLLDENLLYGNYEGARHNLQVLIDKTPHDPRLAARMACLVAGEAEPGDVKLARMLMRHHRHRGDLPAAVREAKKYLVDRPNDWEALTIMAEEALVRRDRARAVEYVAQMPDPHSLNENIPPWACMVAARLFRELNEPDRLNDLISFVAERYVPTLKSTLLTTLGPVARFPFVELYTLTLAQLSQRPQLKSYWVPVQEICHAVAGAPEVPTSTLVRLGEIQELQLETHLRQMVKAKLITPDEYRQLGAEIEQRLTRIWARVRQADPKNPYGFVGLAMQRARAGAWREAQTILDDGLAACGPRPELIERKAELLRRIDPAEGLTFLEQALTGTEISLPLARMLALEAVAAGRPDKALDAIRRAKELDPNVSWVGLEADILVQAGRPAEAAAALDGHRSAVAGDHAACALYVQALCQSNAADRAVAFLTEAQRGTPAAVALLSGIESLVRAGHLEPSVELLRHIVRRDPLNVHAQVVLGDCLRAMAEQAPGGWDRDLVDDALRAYEVAAARFPNNLRMVNNIAWLQLVAQDRRQSAYETAAPLRAANRADLPAEMLETLGATHAGVGEWEPARDALLLSLQRGGPRVTTLAYLALAYHSLGRSADAVNCLRQARDMPKAHPRDAELFEKIRQTILRAG